MTHRFWKLVHQMNVTLRPNQSGREKRRARGTTGSLKVTSWTCSSTLPRRRSLQTFTQSWRKCECRDRQGSHQEKLVLQCSEGFLMSFHFPLIQQNGQIFPATGRGLGNLRRSRKEENHWVWRLSASVKEVPVQRMFKRCFVRFHTEKMVHHYFDAFLCDKPLYFPTDVHKQNGRSLISKCEFLQSREASGGIFFLLKLLKLLKFAIFCEPLVLLFVDEQVHSYESKEPELSPALYPRWQTWFLKHWLKMWVICAYSLLCFFLVIKLLRCLCCPLYVLNLYVKAIVSAGERIIAGEPWLKKQK